MLLNSAKTITRKPKFWRLGTLLLAGVALSQLAHAAITDGTEQPASSYPIPPVADQVDFAANTISYDELNQDVIAEGDVEIMQDEKIVRAQKVVYHLQTEKVEALGDVILLDKTGDIHFADQVELEKQFSNGYIKKLRSVLADGSRITAEEGERIDGTKIVMKKATYTPCEPCKADPSKPPTWQLKADKVTHDKEDHSITYNDATLEVMGVPVAWTPYFSHPDGTIKQKSGVLPPKFSLNSQLGFGVSSSYYWAIDPSQDATIGARVFTSVAPQIFGEYRKRFDRAMIKFNGSSTYSDRKYSIGEETYISDEEYRGHLFGEGLWDVNDKWRAGFKSQITTDDQYLREYDVTNEDVLENEIYAERFEGRNYFVTRALAFQDIRTSERSADQPNIFPEFEASFLGSPDNFLGGRWSADISGLSLVRKGNGQDMGRLSMDLGWQRRDIASFGLVNTFNINARSDYYNISDRNESLGAGDATATRLYPVLHDVLSFPVEKQFESSQLVIEPTASLTLSTNSKNDTGIPNEDSQDVQIDALNIFNANRFPGLDRTEDRSHVTYGIRTGIYEFNGDSLETFLGQSFRFENEDNPFPDGSGLSDQKSDVVGQIVARYKEMFTLNYGFQLASSNLQSERHELDGKVDFGQLTLSGTYLYARALEGTDLNTSREQIYGSAGYKLDDEWTLKTSARYDFSAEDEGLRYAGMGLDYEGQCVSIYTAARRKFTFEDTGDNSTEVTVSLGLKNLGSFGDDR
ncbi:MAG TPA: LPS assembly protein LptD [Alphaproteobacteria bacterium]|nr:LPS assembly protein LptD [Alphaproteobacteria bacterium]